MPALNVPNIGGIGLIEDIPCAGLPLGAFTRAENVRFTGQSIERAGAWNSILLGQPAVLVRKLLRHIIPDNEEELYIFNEDSTCFVTQGTAWENVTPSGHSGTTGDATATSTSLALLPYFSSENYPVIGRAFGSSTDMSYIMAGTDHEDSTWRVVRALKDRLFVFNETTSGNIHPQRAQWSGPVGNRELATDWDTDGTSSTSGWADLVGFHGEILDAYPLGEYMYVYGAQGISRMWESGDDFIFNNAPVVADDGVLATHCVVPVPGMGHFVVGRNSIYLFDGQVSHHIAINRVEKKFRDTIDVDSLHRIFVYPDYEKNEIWVCYKSNDTAQTYFTSATRANRALVWSYKHNTWSFRDIPNLVDMVTWSVQYDQVQWGDMTSDAWGTTPGSWSTSDGLAVKKPTGYCEFFTGPGGSCPAAVLHFNDGAYPGGNNYNNPSSFVSRSSIDFTQVGLSPWTQKQWNRISIAGHNGGTSGTYSVAFRAYEHYQGDVTISDYQTYNPSTQTWLNSRMQGQLLGYTIVATGTNPLNLTGITLDVDEIAQR